MRTTRLPLTSRPSPPLCEALDSTTNPPLEIASRRARSTTSSNSFLGTDNVSDAVWITRGPTDGTALSCATATASSPPPDSAAPTSAAASSSMTA